MSTLTELKEELLTLYNTNAKTLMEGVGDEVNAFRKNAYDDFKRLGIPTRKEEAYKYTNLEKYLVGDYSFKLAPENYGVKLENLFSCHVPQLDTHLVLMLNGYLHPAARFGSELPKGVIISSFAKATKVLPEIVNKHYGKYANSDQDSLVALNSLFAHDGVFVHVPKNVVLDKPIQIINVGYSDENLRINRRNLLVFEEGSQAEVLFCDHTMSSSRFITNSLSEVYVGENANVDFCRLQNENSVSSQISNFFVHQESHSVFSSNTLNLNGGLVRNNVFAKLNGEGIENNTYGLFLLDKEQHASFYTHVQHAKPRCVSNQLIKGILDDKATGAFNGKIYVDDHAIKTEAYQRNNNILLSGNAKMNTKPQLEIYNDDVKCSHGATVGQLDKDAMFYIRSRGVGEKEAKQLLMYAFANEVIGKIKQEALRDRIINLVDKRLRGEMTVCD
ncbi:MAG: Fe-S cluster assembly protein SufD, partial [Bacteroidales bacterium]|nr:Fe-S cluster assembly protein SufD [Bacteroidales bacterium]